MPLTLARVSYAELNARQKENFNYQKLSAVLTDYGFVTIRLSDDWQCADFIALHKDGESLKVQLKGRLCFYKKYIGKDLYIAFSERGQWYLYSHDEVLQEVLDKTKIAETQSWMPEDGGYAFASMSELLLKILSPHRIKGRYRSNPMTEASDGENRTLTV